MTTLNILNAIAENLFVGMSFHAAVAVVNALAGDLPVYITHATDDDYAFITVGYTYSDSLDISFDDDNNIDDINVTNGDDLDW